MIPSPTPVSHPVSRALALAVAALALAGLAPRAARACSPAPCIAANPNPVIVQGAAQGTTTLDWNAGLASGPPTIVVLVGSQIVGTYQVSASGTQQLPVQVGKTYDVKLAADRTGEKVLAAVQVAVHGKINLPGPPKTIKNVRVIAHGTWVELQFSAPFPSKAAVWISKNAPQGNSEQGLQVVRYAPAIGGYQTQHTKKIYDIAPDSHFYYLIRATSNNGLRAHASGDFDTKKRVATVSVSKIKVIDDSDELSAGDLVFGFYINPTYTGQLGDVYKSYPAFAPPYASVDSGDFVSTPGVQLVLNNAGDSLEFNTTGFDSDSDGCGHGLLLAIKGIRNNSCGDTSGRTETHPLTPNGPGQEEYTRNFQMNVGYDSGGKLKFRVYGSLKVSYVN
jgi:hypothetical protein